MKMYTEARIPAPGIIVTLQDTGEHYEVHRDTTPPSGITVLAARATEEEARTEFERICSEISDKTGTTARRARAAALWRATVIRTHTEIN